MPIPPRYAQEKVKDRLQYDTFVIRHEYDIDNLLISFEESKDTPPLDRLLKVMIMKSLDRIPDYPKEPPCVRELNDTNKTPFGKIMVKINTLENFFCVSTFFLRITTGPYAVETRHITFDIGRY